MYLTQFVTEGLDTARPLVVDTETIGLYGKTRLVQVRQGAIHYEWDCFQIPIREIQTYLLKFKYLVFHNAHYDLSCQDFIGFAARLRDPQQVVCTLAAARIAFPRFASHALDFLAQALDLGAKGAEARSDWGALALTASQLEYAAQDTALTEALFTRIPKDVFLSESYRLDIYNIIYAAQYQFRGLPIDKAACLSHAAELATEARAVADLPADLNVNSPKQVAEFLGEKSTDKSSLMKLNTPQSRAILKKRKLLKEAEYLRELAKHDRAISIVNPCGTTTGRFAASGRKTAYPNAFNLQQIPRNAKKAFKARYFICADYPALEIHLAAAITGDEAMAQLLRSGEDLHLRTAQLMFNNRALTKKDPERQIAKTCNFQLLYGSGAQTLASKFIESDKHEFAPKSAEFKDLWLNTFPTIKEWQSRYFALFDALSHGSEGILVRTALGRELLADKPTSALNYQVQGSGAECTKLAIGIVAARGFESKILMNVHDSIIMRAEGEAEARECAEALASAMAEAFEIVVNFGVCKITDLKVKVDAEISEHLT